MKRILKDIFSRGILPSGHACIHFSDAGFQKVEVIEGDPIPQETITLLCPCGKILLNRALARKLSREFYKFAQFGKLDVEAR